MMPDSKRTRLWQVIQGVIYAMVVCLFVVWVAFGTAQVNKQNKAILDGVHRQLDAQVAAGNVRECAIATMLDNITQLSTGVPPHVRKESARLLDEACIPVPDVGP